MSFVLFVLGLVVSAAGLLMVGLGIPINEFSLGNTLIIAGTTAFAGGLVVLALAVILRQLNRIADLLAVRADRPVEIHEAAPASRAAAPRPAPSPESSARAPSFPERPFTPAPMEMSDDADFEPVRLDRPGGSSRMPSAPSEFEPIEDVPLSQRTQPRIPGIGAAPPSEPGAGQRGWRPPGSRPPPLPPSEPPIRREPPIGMPERPQRPAPEAAFDTIWPPERRADKTEPQPDAESRSAGRGAAERRRHPPHRAAESGQDSGVDPEVRRGRWNGLHALYRRLDRSRTGARRGPLRLDRGIAQPPRKRRLTSAARLRVNGKIKKRTRLARPFFFTCRTNPLRFAGFRIEAERATIHTIALSGRPRSIRKHMPKMRIAIGATDFGASHAM